MTSKRLGALHNIQGRLNARGYFGILEQDLYSTLWDLEFNVEEVIFQQDNASSHSTKIVSDWLRRQPFYVLEWLAQFPDLNPIENVSTSLKHRLNSYSTPPNGILQLWKRVQEVFFSISVEECKGLFASMPD